LKKTPQARKVGYGWEKRVKQWTIGVWEKIGGKGLNGKWVRYPAGADERCSEKKKEG